MTTAVVPAAPIISPGRFGGGNALGLGGFGGGFGGGLPPKIRAIFIPQAGPQLAAPIGGACCGGFGGGMYSSLVLIFSKIDSLFLFRSRRLRRGITIRWLQWR